MSSIARRERNFIAAASLAMLAIGAGLIDGRSIPHLLQLAVLLALAGIVYLLADRGGVFDIRIDAALEARSAATDKRRSRGALALTVLFALAITYVALTGAFHSPFFCLLYLPLLLLTIRYGTVHGLAASFVLAAAYLLAAQPLRPMQSHWLEAVSLTFPLAALFGSVFSARLAAGYRAISLRQAELTALMDVSRMLETALDLETTVNLMVLNAQSLIPCDNCAVYLCDDSGALALRASAGPASGLMKRNIGAEEAFRASKVRFGDEAVAVVRRSEGIMDASSGRGSALLTTLRGTDRVLGVLYLDREGSGGFLPDELKLLARYAGHIGLPLQQARYRDNLEWMAFNDPMTGLANYRYFQRRLADELIRAQRYERPLSLVMLDIDFFKSFNDTRGHRAGDELLAGLGKLLKETVRQGDLAARYGGEEFAVLCPEAAQEDAFVVAERIRVAVEQARFALPDQAGGFEPARVTVSVGVGTFPDDALVGDALVQAADQALYAAKAAGRNCVALSGAGVPEPHHQPFARTTSS